MSQEQRKQYKEPMRVRAGSLRKTDKIDKPFLQGLNSAKDRKS